MFLSNILLQAVTVAALTLFCKALPGTENVANVARRDNDSEIVVPISALSAGYLHLLEEEFIYPWEANKTYKIPSMSFLLHHPNEGKVLVDLGVRKDVDKYPPVIKKRTEEVKVEVAEDVVDALAKGDVKPTEINHVLFSHVHWDHTGDHRPFSNAKFWVMNGTLDLIHGPKSYPKNPEGSFDTAVVPEDRTNEVGNDGSWVEFGIFNEAVDLFGDGSIHFANAPGHLEGHAVVIVRTANNRYVMLGGDSTHHPDNLKGTIAVLQHCPGSADSCDQLESTNIDAGLADTTVNRIRIFKDNQSFESTTVIMAHDFEWENENKNKFFPASFT